MANVKNPRELPLHHLGIDVRTKDAHKLRSQLKKLQTTVDVSVGHVYREDPTYSQVHLTTTWAVPQLDDWLYRCASVDYVGTFDLSE